MNTEERNFRLNEHPVVPIYFIHGFQWLKFDDGEKNDKKLKSGLVCSEFDVGCFNHCDASRVPVQIF